jgi:hypothetical protein
LSAIPTPKIHFSISGNKVRLSLSSPYKHTVPGLWDDREGKFVLVETSMKNDYADGEYDDFYNGERLQYCQ